MTNTSGLWAGALSLLLIHDETDCIHSALNASRLLELLGELEEIDDETRGLCERASARLGLQRANLPACSH
ncbi:MAG: hypothetical protein PHV02_12840 [Rhodocyclaceae bacterium]|nr:hypothetical protein [Rhodocyclaceae bacterium]